MRAKLTLSILGGTAGISAAALYSAHAPVPVLSYYDHAITRAALAFLSGIADTLQDLPVLGIRAYRARPIEIVPIDGNYNDAMLAPISGEVLSQGAVGTGGLIDMDMGGDVYIREVLGAGERDPLSARGVRVTAGDISGYTDYTIRYVHIRPRPSDSLYTVAPTDVSFGLEVRALPGSLGTFRASVERAVYSGVWDGGLLALVALSGPGRRHKEECSDSNSNSIRRRDPLSPAPQPASLLLVFECADDGFASLVNVGEHVTAGQPIAKVAPYKQNSNNSSRELDEYKERRQTAAVKPVGRVRRSW